MKNNKDFPEKLRINKYPLTVGQKGLWFLYQLDPLSDSYNMPLTFKFANNVSVNDLEKILTVFVQRHPMMRSTFHEIYGNLLASLDEQGKYCF